MSNKAFAGAHATTTTQEPTPWYGMPRCDELPEQTRVEKALRGPFQWAQNQLNKTISVLPGGEWLGEQANKMAPWNYKDGPFGRCPIDENAPPSDHLDLGPAMGTHLDDAQSVLGAR